MKQRHYTLHTVWTIDASRNTVWQALTVTPFTWSRWWPELRVVDAIRQTPNLTGSEYVCNWKAHGYALHSTVQIASVRARRSIVLRSSGDLEGTAECELSEKNGHTIITITWHVSTTKRWMNALSPVLAPIFVLNHHAVMRSGERGLNRYLNS